MGQWAPRCLRKSRLQRRSPADSGECGPHDRQTHRNGIFCFCKNHRSRVKGYTRGGILYPRTSGYRQHGGIQRNATGWIRLRCSQAPRRVLELLDYRPGIHQRQFCSISSLCGVSLYAGKFSCSTRGSYFSPRNGKNRSCRPRNRRHRAGKNQKKGGAVWPRIYERFSRVPISG